MAEYSPMMQQYFEIKNKHKDHILFYRLGDFYEMFFDDALLASKELELTLTGRECGQQERAPMCGVPHHSSEAYIARLIEKGYKIAICEQVEDPATAKGIVKRDVVRVVTPGTVIESSMLAEDKNNYLASVYIKGDEAGVCFADVSTGTAKLTELSGADIAALVVAELQKFMPSEIIFNEELLKHKQITATIKNTLTASVELMDNSVYAPPCCAQLFEAQFGSERTFEGSLSQIAFAAILSYLGQTQKKGLERLRTLVNYENSQIMNLPKVTRTNLELCETMIGRERRGTLLWVLDETETAMGKRMLRSYIEQPLVSAPLINRRLNAVEELIAKTIERAKLREILSGVYDIERLMTRIVYGSATPRELYAFMQTCAKLPALKQLLATFKSEELLQINAEADDLADICLLIFNAVKEDPPALLKDGGFIKTGYNEEVDSLRDIVNGGKGILTSLEAKLREQSGIKTLKVGYNKVFGYYIEVSNSYVSQVPAYFVRKQTLTGGERYITEELKELEGKILGAHERLVSLETALYSALLAQISNNVTRVQACSNAIAKLDVLHSYASVAVAYNYTKPVVDAGELLTITEGRHPVVERVLKNELFVPNSSELDCEQNRMIILTGPNMAGKSTFMRQTAIIALMAQIGCFVPAKAAHIGVLDSIFTRVGAQDDLSAGKSTFMVEMTEVAYVVKNATRSSLVILDEIGRGTSTFDGMSIARAVIEHIATQLACKTLFATHYHELTELEGTLDGAKNYNIAVKKRGDDITFLRRIVRGPADDSYGIEVAKLAGVPHGIIERAKQILAVLESAEGASSTQNLDYTQLTLASSTMDAKAVQLFEAIKAIDVETLTPIEALNALNALKKAATER